MCASGTEQTCRFTGQEEDQQSVPFGPFPSCPTHLHKQSCVPEQCVSACHPRGSGAGSHFMKLFSMVSVSGPNPQSFQLLLPSQNLGPKTNQETLSFQRYSPAEAERAGHFLLLCEVGTLPTLCEEKLDSIITIDICTWEQFLLLVMGRQKSKLVNAGNPDFGFMRSHCLPFQS